MNNRIPQVATVIAADLGLSAAAVFTQSQFFILALIGLAALNFWMAFKWID